MFRLKESASGQLLNHVSGTSIEWAHFWDPKMFTTVRKHGYCCEYFGIPNVHFHLMYL